MYEQPYPRPRLSPGVIAMLVVLAVAAGTMSYLVARQVLANRDPNLTGQGGQTPGPSTPATTTSRPGATPTQNPKPPATPTFGPDRSRTNDGESCPDVTKEAVKAGGLNDELTLKIYIEFNVARGKARAWVCENADDVLIYQAHERFGPFDRADNAVNTILLAKGIKGEVTADGESFVATNTGPGGGVTSYTVTAEEFILDTPSGEPERTAVTKVIQPG